MPRFACAVALALLAAVFSAACRDQARADSKATGQKAQLAAAAGAANPIVAENGKPGTTAWIVRSPNQRAIAGYVDRTSYLPGSQVTMFVDTHGDDFTYRVYRMGWYQGLGGREVLDQSTPLPGVNQPRYTVHSPGHYLSSNWRPTASFTIPTDWVSGFYVIVLRDQRSGAHSYECFTLRSPDPAPVVVEFQTDTWTAYNDWDGYSAYYRSQRISENRPWSHGGGSSKFFLYDMPLVEFLERLGYPVSYATNDDLGANRIAGPSTRLLIESGHPEYHSMAERKVITSLPRRGVSVAILGGNAWTVQVHFNQGARIMALWRSKKADPVKGALASVRWEQLGWPQNRFTGSMQAWGTPTGHSRAMSAQHWAWHGAGVKDGDRLLAPQGWEFDGVDANGRSPRNLTVLSRSPLSFPLAGRGPVDTDMTIMDRPNGTFVFDAGQLGFNWALQYPSYPGVDVTHWINARYPARPHTSRRLRRLVGNLIQHATAIANPVAPVKASRQHHAGPDTIVAPISTVVPAGTPLVVSWTRPATGAVATQVKVGARGARVAATQQTWTGGSLAAGWRVISVRSFSASGRTLATRRLRVLAVPRGSIRFRYAFGFWRAYLE